MATSTITQTQIPPGKSADIATAAQPSSVPISKPKREFKGNSADVNRIINHDLLAKPVTDAEYHKAIEIIKNRLPLMAATKAKFTVELGEGRSEILIDARSSEPTLDLDPDAAPDTDAKIFIRAPMVKRLSDGILDSRYATRWGDINMIEGPPRVGVKFGDALTGLNQIHPKLTDLDLSKLPKPTEDMEQVKRDLDRWGYGFIKDAITPDEIARLKKRTAEQAKGEAEAGIGVFDGGPTKPNQRILCLPNKGQEYLDLLENKAIDALVPELYGDNAILFSYTANIARPGGQPMFMHTDQITIQPPIRSLAVGMNMMFFLTDVTAENGGTLVMPGSHKGNLAPDDPWNPVDTVAASGPAGTCMVFESRLWHATGANTVPGSERPVLLLYFTRPWMRQQENFSLSLKDEVYEQCSDRVKAFLGFKMSGTIGGVQGLNATEGSIVRRPHTDEYIGVLGVGSLDK